MHAECILIYIYIYIFFFFYKLQFNKKQKQDYKGGYLSLQTATKSVGRISLK